MEEDNKEEAANDSVCLGDLGALLEVVEDGVLGELLRETCQASGGGQKREESNLLVELVDVEGGLVGSLDVDGVLLELLGSGHGG